MVLKQFYFIYLLLFILCWLFTSTSKAQSFREHSVGERALNPTNSKREVFPQYSYKNVSSKRSDRSSAITGARNTAKSNGVSNSTNRQEMLNNSKTSTPVVVPNVVPKVSEKKSIDKLQVAKKSKKNWSLKTGIYYEQSPERKSDGTQTRATVVELTPSYKTEIFSITNQNLYSFDGNDSSESDWSDSTIVAKYLGWKPFKSIKIAPSLEAEIPLSRESSQNRGINLVSGAALNFGLNSKYLDIEHFSLGYKIGAYNYFNDYTTRVNGDPATNYKILQVVTSALNFEPVEFSIDLEYASSYSYDSVVRNSFFHLEVLSFKLVESLTFSLYHYNKGPFFKPTTYENNVKYYDKESSIFGGGIDYVF